MKPVIPLIHMNGNSKDKLAKQYRDAYLALDEAIYLFNQIEFHPRDYYPLEAGAWDKAVEERGEVKAAFMTIKDYLNEIRVGIDNQK